MKITVHGAARTTTGSMYLLELSGKRILFECGFFQGKRKEAMDRNRAFPFDPASIDVLLLSHAHIDHSGNIPNLVRQGFTGPILTTHASCDLVKLMLEDSAHIQEADCAYINQRNQEEGKVDAPVAEPLYTVKDAAEATKHLMSVSYDRPFEIAEGVKITFRDAGHILGSAEIIFDLKENGKKTRLAFSGDLGRGNGDLLRDPTPFKDVDVLILESTYGGRVHEPQEIANYALAEIINRTKEKGGKLIIPAFSVGRSQQLIYSLNHLTKEKLIPKIPVYVDSPLSVNATEVFKVHPECLKSSIAQKLRRHQNPFHLDKLTYITSAEESKALNGKPESCIIISASGMCEAGRIRHHLKNNIGDPRNTVLIVGFCAPNTLGRSLSERHSTVSIFGSKHEVKAKIEVLNAFSAHADRNELLDLLKRSTGSMKRIFLTHGQEDQSEALAKAIKEMKPESNITIPELHESFEL
jgi:metallo-beta-lactamase family protein